MTVKLSLKELEKKVQKLEKLTSELKEVKEQLEESEEKYRKIFEHAVVSIDMRDAESSELVAFNRESHELLGYTRKEFAEIDWRKVEVVKSQEEMHRDIERLLREGSVTFEAYHRTKSGDIKTMLVSSVLIKIGGKDYFQHIGVDITELKKIQEALRKMNDKLELRVQERTAELVEKNKQLSKEIEERKEIEKELPKKEKELEKYNVSLEEMNTALRVLLQLRDNDIKEMGERVAANVKELIGPHLENLKRSNLNHIQKARLGAIESNLNKITSPFLKKLPATQTRFTRKEIQVAGLLKEGKSTKEIAQIMDLSIGAIEFHRKNLRKKLGLTNTKHNLGAYLSSIS